MGGKPATTAGAQALKDLENKEIASVTAMAWPVALVL
jgi:hypothetical protein